MLTEKDFDDIGKRLYDLEADPPEKGWNKIAADIIPPPAGPGKRTFMGRHWWKGLLIVLPLSVYLVWSDNKPVLQEGNLSAFALETTERKQSEATIAETERGGTSSSAMKGNNAAASDIPENADGRTEPVKKSGTNASTERTDFEQLADSDPGVSAQTKYPNEVVITNDRGDISNSKTSDTPGIKAKATLQVPEENPDQRPGKKENAVTMERNNITTKNPTAIPHAEPSQITSTPQSEGDTRTASSENPENNERVNTGIDAGLVASGKHPESADNFAQPSERTTLLPNEDLKITNANDETTSETVSINDSSNRPDTKSNQALTFLDSADSPRHVDLPISRDHAVDDEPEQNEKEKRESTWRLSAAVAPQFSYKSVTPVGNDEVLVTNISTRSGYPDRAGFGFAIGAGKEILRNLYLDAQLTYSRTSQTIDFTYATGKVDTLLAVQGQDGNVRVIPVYQVSDREQKSTLGYGGIRMTATHYFWSRGKRRFNITAGAGLNLMVSNTFEEKVNGMWIRYENLPLSKTNYNFTLAAGYNVAFGNGWEIMFSPMLTYYLKKIEVNPQPFRLAHRSYGLNITLSKSLR